MFKPFISVILNIAEDHLDRHKTFENYIQSKMGLIKNCTEKSMMVLNADDKIIMERTKDIKARKYYISEFEKVKGVYVYKNKIYANLGKVEEIVCLDEIEHTYGIVQDVLASVLVGLLLKVDKARIVNAIKSFKVSPHRIELVESRNGIKYIDDSKSTNVHSSLHALKICKDKVILLLGGVDKKLNFESLFQTYSEKIDQVVAFGSARKKIVACAKKCGFDRVLSVARFSDAVNTACKLAKESNIVLLSPGCASFDEFTGYAQRGEEFAKIVKGYINAKV